MMHTSWFRLAAFVFIVAPSAARAADAFFSPDGKTVTTSVSLPSAVSGLVRIDIASGKVTPLPLPAALKDAEITSLARGAEGETLFLANDAVWVLKDGEAARVLVSTAPLKNPSGLFIGTRKGSPVEDWLFITAQEDENRPGWGTFYARKPGTKKFASIFCRRVEDAVAGIFSGDGRLFFVSSSDVWEGLIQPDADGGDRLGVLVGSRIAPLAFLNTDEANGGGMFVHAVCPAGKWLYAMMRGHHMAALVRTPLPAKPLYTGDDGGFPTVKDSYAAMAQSLSRAEIISEDLEDTFGFCATEVNGKPLVFFYTRPGEENKGPALRIWTGSGALKTIGHLPKSKD